MIDTERLKAEVAAVGFTLLGIDQGIPVCEEKLSKSEETLVSAIVEEHIGDSSAYVAADLDTIAAKTKAAATAGQFTAYKAIQDTTKDNLNDIEYAKTLGKYLKWRYAEETGDPTAAAKRTAWLDAMSGISILSMTKEKLK